MKYTFLIFTHLIRSYLNVPSRYFDSSVSGKGIEEIGAMLVMQDIFKTGAQLLTVVSFITRKPFIQLLSPENCRKQKFMHAKSKLIVQVYHNHYE